MKNELEPKENTTFNNKLYDELKSILATIILQNIVYWCHLNEVGKKQAVFADGIYWTSLSYDQIYKSIPFRKGVSTKQIQRAIQLLYDKGYIKKKRKFNDNNWYAPTDKVKEFLGTQQYENLTKYNNENYNPMYDKNETNTVKDFKSAQEYQQQELVQPQQTNDYSEYEYGSKRQKTAFDPVTNDDIVFQEDFSYVKKKSFY